MKELVPVRVRFEPVNISLFFERGCRVKSYAVKRFGVPGSPEAVMMAHGRGVVKATQTCI
jgi:hypothetical protein